MQVPPLLSCEANMQVGSSTDAALERKPVISLEGQQLTIQGIDVSTATVGQEFIMVCKAKITGVNQYTCPDEPDKKENSISFELAGIRMETEKKDPLVGMFPNSPAPVR